MTGTAPDSYAALLARFQPRPIQSEAEAERVQAEIDRLIDQGELTEEERAFHDLSLQVGVPHCDAPWAETIRWQAPLVDPAPDGRGMRREQL